MAPRPGRARLPVERPETAPDDEASAWARFLRLLIEAEAQSTDAPVGGAWARFLRRISSVRDRSDDDECRDA